jgi:hypothetical protein
VEVNDSTVSILRFDRFSILYSRRLSRSCSIHLKLEVRNRLAMAIVGVASKDVIAGIRFTESTRPESET